MRIDAIDKDTTDPSATSSFQRARALFGWLPNTIRVMARGSAAADVYLTAVELNSSGCLSTVERELVAVLTLDPGLRRAAERLLPLGMGTARERMAG
ncbi:MAG TPA: hypothetical protein VH061_03280 [Solirubrobacteraceae bacterium]|jgi:hypothetical protein|nr:hypothetical protein [Solirubrobacteraceae bacterium]